MKRRTIVDLYAMKERGEKIAWLALYDYPTARFAEAAGMDMILVGDSLGMCVYGYHNTLPVTMDQCVMHTEAVRRGAPGCFLVGDMPFGSYQSCDAQAVDSAGRFLKECDVDAVKLEGGLRVVSRIRAITDAGINVIGHIGLTPQSSGQLGGYKVQGRTASAARLLVKDALAVQAAGASMLLLEGVPAEVTHAIWKKLSIPVLGIGAGRFCDGQVLVVSDITGQFQAFTPQFVKKYCNIAETVTTAMQAYIKDIKEGTFPDNDTHCYHMADGEEGKFLQDMEESLAAQKK